MAFDLAVIGAGPAGMAAATLAADRGLSVALIDEQPAPGGQIWRNVTFADKDRMAVLGPDYRAGLDIAAAVARAGVTHLPGAVVWDVTADGQVTWSRDGKAAQAQAAQLLIATGALERPVPVPGWTLPGVMTAGAAQILMKTPGLVAQDAVIAGSGPLIYLLAAQMIAAGSPPRALVETQTRGDTGAALRHVGGALRGWRVLAKGARLLARIRAAGVPRHTAATGLRVEGRDAATGIAFRAGGRDHAIPCDTVLLHQGVVPNTQITRALRLDHRWDDAQHCFHLVTDAWGGTALDRVHVAGDGAGIGGAAAAVLAGRIAALDILCRLGRIDRAQRDGWAAPLRRALAAERAIRPFLDAAYPPPPEILTPPDDVTVCRCEAVSAGDIRRFARLGCLGPNQAKAFGRAGMGPCQGRTCGLTVTAILAAEHRTSPGAVGSYRIRAPLKPVTLGELASLDAPTQEGTTP